MILDTLLPVALNDTDEKALKEGFAAYMALTKKTKKELLANYLEQVREIILNECKEIPGSHTGDEIKGKLLPGLLLPNGLEPFYPMYQHGLMYGQPDVLTSYFAFKNFYIHFVRYNLSMRHLIE